MLCIICRRRINLTSDGSQIELSAFKTPNANSPINPITYLRSFSSSASPYFSILRSNHCMPFCILARREIGGPPFMNKFFAHSFTNLRGGKSIFAQDEYSYPDPPRPQRLSPATAPTIVVSHWDRSPRITSAQISARRSA